MKKIECVNCRHRIDSTAKICPYCGADPRTGEKFDTAAIVQTHFPKRQTLTTRERILDFVRMRQAIVVTLVCVVFFGLVTALHSVVTRRNATASSQAPAIPLTEIADLSNDSKLQQDVPMPDLQFAYDGKARNMRTLLMEPGAVTPVATPDPNASPSPSPSTPAVAAKPSPTPLRPVNTPQTATPPPSPAATATP